MKVNKAIYLRFNTTSSSTASINVPFLVKSIHIKSAVYQSDANPVEQYITLSSDLTNWEPMAQIYNDTTKAPANQFCDISFQPSQPFNVNNTYNFILTDRTGVAYSAPTNDYVNLILEFNGVDTPDT